MGKGNKFLSYTYFYVKEIIRSYQKSIEIINDNKRTEDEILLNKDEFLNIFTNILLIAFVLSMPVIIIIEGIFLLFIGKSVFISWLFIIFPIILFGIYLILAYFADISTSDIWELIVTIAYIIVFIIVFVIFEIIFVIIIFF